MLVSTYAPGSVLQECFKSLCILSFNEIVMCFVNCQPASFILLVCVVYVDACSTRSTKFASDVRCGLHAMATVCYKPRAVMFWRFDNCVLARRPHLDTDVIRASITHDNLLDSLLRTNSLMDDVHVNDTLPTVLRTRALIMASISF